MVKQIGINLMLWILAIAVSTGACTKHSHTNNSADDVPQASACSSLNLVRDASWTANFVKSFVSCISDSKDSSRHKFALTIDVLNQLGDKALQSSLDMLQWTADGKEVFLGLGTSFLERGVASDPAKRWVGTQALLEDTKPYALLHLMLELKKRNLLDPLLDTLQSADDTLPQGFIEAGVRQFLTEPAVKADATTLVKSVLADRDVYDSWTTFLLPDPKPMSDDCGSDPTCPYEQAGISKSSAQHWLDFWSSLAPTHREHLALALAQVVQATLQQSDEVALDRSDRLLSLAKQTVARSKGIYAQGHEALRVLLDTPLKSYEPFINGLNQVKDNPIYSDAFLEKMGSARMQDVAEDFLNKGGKPKACAAALPGVSSSTERSTREVLLKTLLTPQTSCGGKVPVLLALSDSLGYDCAQSTCSVSLWPEADADATDLMSFYFNRIATDLQTDVWSLFRFGAARRDVPTDVWAKVVAMGKGQKLVTPDDLLAFETAVSSAYSDYLPENWLELSLNKTLLDLSQLEQSFAGVFPDRDPVEQWYYSDADSQFARLAFGLYPMGPMDQVHQQLFNLNQLQKDWTSAHPTTKVEVRDLSPLLAPLRSLAAQYRNPLSSFKPEAEKVALPWLGSTKNTVNFGKDGKNETTGDLLKTSLLFDETDGGFAVKARYKEQLALATASLPKEEAEEFRRWMVDVWLPAQINALPSVSNVSPAAMPVALFDRTALTAEEARMVPYFFGQEFTNELNQAPQGAAVNALPDTNTNPKVQAPRAYYGASVMGGADHPWTSFWAFRSSGVAASKTSFAQIRDSLVGDETTIKNEMNTNAAAPVLISQGLLDVTDGDKLTDHQKLLVQLHLLAPIFENRGKQYFMPAVGFSSYCAQKPATTWTAGQECPFRFADFAAYKSFIQTRFTRGFCATLPTQGLDAYLATLGLSDTPAAIQQMCAGVPSTTLFPKAWLQTEVQQILAMGKDPHLKPGLRAIPEAIAWLKAQKTHSTVQLVKSYMSHTPILDGGTSARLLQRHGVYEAFYANLPGAAPAWLSYLSRDIGLKGTSDALKVLGSQPIADSQQPVVDFLGMIASNYQDATAKNDSTLGFFLKLSTSIAKSASARETVIGTLGKPYDPYAGILMAYTLPQAVKAGIFPEFSWDTYAPLKLLLASQNLYVLQGLVSIYDRDTLDWFDAWVNISAQFPDTETMANESRPLLNWLRAYLKTWDASSSAEFTKLVGMRDWQIPLEAGVRVYRLQRVSLPDLSNQWHEAFYFQAVTLSHTFVETLPKLLDLKDKFLGAGGDKNALPEAFLGMMQGVLKHDGNETAAWLQDQRMGFRAPSFFGSALRDKDLRAKLEDALSGLDNTSRDQWQQVKDDWDELGPDSHRLIDYLAKNLVLKNDKALYQKTGLQSLSNVTGNPDHWAQSQKVFDSWLDSSSVLTQWQENKP